MSEKTVTHSDAQAILRRFNASHWNNPGEHARYSIPADLDRDDDILLARYIAQNRERDAELERIVAGTEEHVSRFTGDGDDGPRGMLYAQAVGFKRLTKLVREGK